MTRWVRQLFIVASALLWCLAFFVAGVLVGDLFDPDMVDRFACLDLTDNFSRP